MEQQQDELVALQSIYADEFRRVSDDSFELLIEPRIDEIRIVLGQNECTVKYFPPFCLSVKYTPNYPAELPVMNLSCPVFATSQIDRLVQELRGMWFGDVVIFAWATWLSEESLQFLGIDDVLLLSSDVDLPEGAVSQYAGGQSAMSIIQSHNALMQRKLFMKTDHFCAICFCETPPSKSMLLNCNHIFCLDCLGTFCTTHIKEGTVIDIVCPDIGCRAPFLPAEVQSIVSSEDFQRYDELVMMRTLDGMADVIYCPKCEKPVVLDEELGHCVFCEFAFCSKCMRAWHWGQTCEDAGGIHVVAKKLRQGLLDPDQKQKAMADLRSYLSLLTTSSPCPKCKSPITKAGGCSKVRCSQCNTSFCWICMKEINGYDHFRNGTCVLFTQTSLQEGPVAAKSAFFSDASEDRLIAALDNDGETVEETIKIAMESDMLSDTQDRRHCRKCNQLMFRHADDPSNRFFCIRCNFPMCWECGEPVFGDHHFSQYGCKKTRFPVLPSPFDFE